MTTGRGRRGPRRGRGVVQAGRALLDRVAEAGRWYVNVPTDDALHLGLPTEVFLDPDILLFLERDVPWIPWRWFPITLCGGHQP